MALRGTLEETWMQHGACRGLEYDEPGLFFPDFIRGRVPPDVQARIDTAKRICAGCVVRPDCLEYAESRHLNPPPVGIWGGEVFFLRRRPHPTHPA